MQYSFDSHGLSFDEVAQAAHDIWSDLAFDVNTRAKLKRDGLSLDGVRLSGPMPFKLTLASDGRIDVLVEAGMPGDILIDLWRMHIVRGLRLRPLVP